jgi:hypothetical protein
MQNVTITSRAGHAWKTAAGIWVLTAGMFALFLAGSCAMERKLPDAFDWIVLAIVPPCLSLFWLGYVYFTSSQRARQLTADESGVTIERPNGRIVFVRWNEIRALEFSALEDEILALQTVGRREVVLGHVFERDDWSRWVNAIVDRVDEQVRYGNVERSFERSVSTWLDRGSVGLLLLGGGAAVALILWKPENAAGWIVLVGTLAVLVYLGSQADNYHQGDVPLASVIGFFAAKAFAIVPLALIVLGVARPAGFNPPAHKHAWLFYVSNGMFFGAMAAALIARGGFSPEQYFADDLQGLNRYHRRVVALAIAICVAGFALKAWNEG